MKNLILILTILPATLRAQSFSDYKQYRQQREVDVYMAPISNKFCMYLNNVLQMTEYTVSNQDLTTIFTTKDQVTTLKSGIMFAIHSDYYKLYSPTDSSLFVVKMPVENTEILNDHLTLMLDLLNIN